ncbi:Cation-independent mannose-6-phosphate receptor CI-MPR, partial [Basidiobolus ranarum]
MWLSRSALWIALICGLGSLTLSPVHGQEKDCTVVNSDTKEFYDLRPLIKKSGEDWTVKSIDDHTYKLNVCHEILDGTTGMREPGGVGSFVRKDVKGISLGKQNSSPLIAENRLRLQYKDGDECPNSLRRRSTLIYLECDKTIQGLGAPEYLDNIDECTYMFLWKTPHACPTAQGG